jgi:hypothetical protein
MMTQYLHPLPCLLYLKEILCFVEFVEKAFMMSLMTSRPPKTLMMRLNAIQSSALFWLETIHLHLHPLLPMISQCWSPLMKWPPWAPFNLIRGTFPTAPLLKTPSSLPASARVQWHLSTTSALNNGDVVHDTLKPEMVSIVKHAVNHTPFHHLLHAPLLLWKKNG